MAESAESTPEERAHKRAKASTSLMWHIGVFIIINAFFWILDLWTGASGLQWAFWITLFWGFALLFHALAWFVDGRQLERRRTQHYLERQHQSTQ